METRKINTKRSVKRGGHRQPNDVQGGKSRRRMARSESGEYVPVRGRSRGRSVAELLVPLLAVGVLVLVVYTARTKDMEAQRLAALSSAWRDPKQVGPGSLLERGSRVNNSLFRFPPGASKKPGVADKPLAAIALPPFGRKVQKEVAVMIIGDRATLSRYSHNIDTVRCYLQRLQNVGLWLVDSNDPAGRACIHVRGFFFKRNCIASRLMKEEEGTVKQILLLDADNAVVNPRADFRGYLPEGKDMAVFMRFHNNEVSWSSAFLRNNKFTQDFLMDLANLYAFWANGDNGALHKLILVRSGLEKQCPDKTFRGKKYSDYVACFHTAVSTSQCVHPIFQRIHVWPHGLGWTYDGWVSRYRWSTEGAPFQHAFKNPPMSHVEGRPAPKFECNDQALMNFTDPYKVNWQDWQHRMELAWIRAIPNRAHSGYLGPSCLWNASCGAWKCFSERGLNISLQFQNNSQNPRHNRFPLPHMPNRFVAPPALQPDTATPSVHLQQNSGPSTQLSLQNRTFGFPYILEQQLLRFNYSQRHSTTVRPGWPDSPGDKQHHDHSEWPTKTLWLNSSHHY